MEVYITMEVPVMVKVFSTKTCPWCTKVKEYLDEKGVAFEEVDVAADRAAAMEMVRKSGQMGVPVTQIGEKFIVGYNTEAIDAELAKEPQ
jgi:glutaredoxin 3